MKKWLIPVWLLLVMFALPAVADFPQRVVDLPTRSGVTQRFLLVTPPSPKAAVILFAGGHGGLQITSSGEFGWGAGNFLVRSRERFAEQGLVVAVVDAPSDRQREPYLNGFRQTAEHAADIQAVIAWLRAETKLPVWLIGTSRGTQSVGYLATALTGPAAPDGVVLTSSILTDPKERAVSEMPLEKLDMPVLVVHHEQDGCSKCRFSDVPALMQRLAALNRKELIAVHGGRSEGDPCQARAYHGFNGLEQDVATRIGSWIDGEDLLLAQRRLSAGTKKN